jgi:hypothetical protein
MSGSRIFDPVPPSYANVNSQVVANFAASGTDRPSSGDLLITRDRSEQHMYTIGTVPGPAQIRFRTYDQALAAAGAWASQHGVGIWFTDDQTTFKKVSVRTESPAGSVEVVRKDARERDA